MNKNEQNRVVAWRLKLLRQASEMPRVVAQTCRHFGLSRKTFYKWRARYKSHGEAGLCDRPRAPLIPRGLRLAQSFRRFCTCESATDSVLLASPAICIASTTWTWHVPLCIAY